MIFTLSPILGGRTEVLNTPFTEALQHLLYYREREEHKAQAEAGRIWLDFHSRMNSHPLSPKEQREKFMRSIEPKDVSKTPTIQQPKQEKQTKPFETNHEIMLHIKKKTEQMIKEKQLKKGG